METITYALKTIKQSGTHEWIKNPSVVNAVYSPVWAKRYTGKTQNRVAQQVIVESYQGMIAFRKTGYWPSVSIFIFYHTMLKNRFFGFCACQCIPRYGE